MLKPRDIEMSMHATIAAKDLKRCPHVIGTKQGDLEWSSRLLRGAMAVDRGLMLILFAVQSITECSAFSVFYGGAGQRQICRVAQVGSLWIRRTIPAKEWSGQNWTGLITGYGLVWGGQKVECTVKVEKLERNVCSVCQNYSKISSANNMNWIKLKILFVHAQASFNFFCTAGSNWDFPWHAD